MLAPQHKKGAEAQSSGPFVVCSFAGGTSVDGGRKEEREPPPAKLFALLGSSEFRIGLDADLSFVETTKFVFLGRTDADGVFKSQPDDC